MTKAQAFKQQEDELFPEKKMTKQIESVTVDNYKENQEN